LGNKNEKEKKTKEKECGEWKKNKEKRKKHTGMEKNAKQKTCEESYITFPTRFRVLLIIMNKKLNMQMRSKDNLEVYLKYKE
jgi:hypothetical protein